MGHSSGCWGVLSKGGDMTRQGTVVIGAAVLLLAIGGAVLCTSCQSKGPVMTDGPGMLYFYSPV